MAFQSIIPLCVLLVFGQCVSARRPSKGVQWPPAAKEGIARDFYVDKNSSGSGNGQTLEEAFKSIQECVDHLEIAGDRCLVSPGNYHEEIHITGKFATEDNPFIVEGIGETHPVLDGTREIGKFSDDQNESGWKLLKHENCRKYPIYYTPYEQKVWQLFINGEMMTNARWPNAKWSDRSLFDASLWGKSTAKTTEKRLFDKNRKLSQSWIDAMDAVAVLNIGSWDTYVSKVINHTRGQDWFDFNNTWGHMEHLNAAKGQYFLESKMEFLDSEEEWFIDDKFIYVWAPEGKDPTQLEVVGKNSSYAITIANSSNIIFRNIDFFATTIKTLPKDRRSSLVGNLTFANLNFRYPSYSRRILGETKKPEWMDIDAYSRNLEEMGQLTFSNCTWFGSDGVPLRFSGSNVLLQNNLWESNDWSCANNDDSSSGGKSTILSGLSLNEKFYRNTLKNNGASAGYRPNRYAHVQLNEISGQCWGLGQNDGSGIQVMIGSQNSHTNILQNWIHDQPKLGIRFDCPNGGTNWNHLGRGATVNENVVWNTGGIMVKGDNHTVTRNLAFSPSYCAVRGAALKPHLNVPHWIGTNPIPFNNDTQVVLNIADFSNGGISRITKKRIPMSGSRVVDNFPQPWDKCEEVVEHLVDSENRDFRPKADSAYARLGAGPYQAGIPAEEAEYWIPGRQSPAASKPIPADGKTVPGNRDVLMFLQGYNAKGHTVYFSSAHGMVLRRSPKAFLKRLEGNSNVCPFPNTLKSNSKYFWAVDAISAEGTKKGAVWMFTTA